MVALLSRDSVDLPLSVGKMGSATGLLRSSKSEAPLVSLSLPLFSFQLAGVIYWHSDRFSVRALSHWASSTADCFPLFLHLWGQRPRRPSSGPAAVVDPAVTDCSQRPALGRGVGWWSPPGTRPPSHCPPRLWRRSGRVHWRGLLECPLERCHS